MKKSNANHRGNSILVFESRVKPDHDGQNLLAVLADRFPYYSRAQWLEQLAQGRVRVNGDGGEAVTIVRVEDVVTFAAGEYLEPEVPTGYGIVFENDDFLLVEKPAGLPVTRTGLIVSKTLVNLLRIDFDNPEISPLHRLDRETSGLLLFAKRADLRKTWQPCLADLLKRKFYLALVQGRMEAERLEVSLPLAELPDSPIRCRMHVVDNGKAALSQFHTIASHSGYSLILAEIVTGRKHQIRAHLAHLGHPIVGDKIYSGGGQAFLKRTETELTDYDYETLGAREHCLHAWALMLARPERADELYFAGNFSSDFQKYLLNFQGWEIQARKGICRFLS